MKLDIESYLKAADVVSGATGTIMNEGVEEERNFGTPDNPNMKKVFEIGVKIGHVEFTWTMNRTNQRNLASKWGKETSKWVGQRIVFEKKEQDVFGKKKQVLYAQPLKSDENAKP